jgi:hypothetical protein
MLQETLLRRTAMVNQPLSSAAQAVLDAYETSYTESGLVAALRAAAEEVVLPKYQYANWEMAHLIMQEILAIAAELEGADG